MSFKKCFTIVYEYLFFLKLRCLLLKRLTIIFFQSFPFRQKLFSTNLSENPYSIGNCSLFRLLYLLKLSSFICIRFKVFEPRLLYWMKQPLCKLLKMVV